VTPKLGASHEPRKSSVARKFSQPGTTAALSLVAVLLTSPAGWAQSARTAPVAVPVPALQPAELEHIKRFDGFIAPVRGLALSTEDAGRLRDAFKAATANNGALARSLRDQMSDATARTMVDWATFRNGAGTAREIRSFISTHPDWPDQAMLTQRMEEQLFLGGGAADEIKAFFKSAPPKTAAGDAAMASALLAEGDQAAAKAYASKAWRSHELAASLEAGFLTRLQSLLTPADHKWRLDRILIDDSRWAADRTARAGAAYRLLPLLSEPERKKAEARIAVYLRGTNASPLIAALPSDAATSPVADWGFAHSLAQWHRRSKRHEAAWKILKGVPVDPALTPNLDAWWEERRAGAYEALKQGKAQIAYDLVAKPGPLSVNPLKDATFLAGWIALRHLNDPKRAVVHLTQFEKAADGPLSRAKAAYWMASAAEATGKTDVALAQRKLATQQTDTFYGMLARQHLDPKAQSITIEPPQAPSADQVARFNANPVVRAAVLARKSGLDAAVTKTMFNHLRTLMPSEGEVALVAHLADATGDPQMSLRIAKAAIARGQNLLYYAYPLRPMPPYQALRQPPEPAFMLSIARQESEFNAATLSGAGARGLLQVMPITANHVCKDYKLTCEIPRLMTDKSYNAMMASAYIADRMDEFRGSYVLTLAGYNAGPGRTRQWIREFGDPRDGTIDPVDWIHRIPFEETREYVQKVLANIQMYRARLGGGATALRLKDDLKRQSTGPAKTATASPGDPPAPADSN
jgi:soluble lytic murein transglycosylase